MPLINGTGESESRNSEKEGLPIETRERVFGHYCSSSEQRDKHRSSAEEIPAQIMAQCLLHFSNFVAPGQSAPAHVR